MILPAILASLAVLTLILLLNGVFGGKRDKQTDERLNRFKSAAEPAVDIERRHSLSSVPLLNKLLSGMGWSSRIDLMIYQAGMSTSVGLLVLASAVSAIAGFMIFDRLTSNALLPYFMFAAGGYAPFFHVERKRKKRMGKFQSQLPDALDLITRALKAGHAFSQGMRMVAEEFEDPIGPEFDKTLDEINFGVSVDRALYNLTRRVDCPDLKFFVISVNIQRETGGNLSEIVSNIAKLVRERFKFHGRVRVLSAEGRLTAYILLALPIVVFFVIKMLNPEYMMALQETHPGRVMMYSAMIMMFFGAMVIRRLVKIKV
jgi:tight adherence protein B